MADWAASRLALLGLFAAIALLTGCAEQRIRSAAEDNLRGGRFVDSVKVLQDGLDRYPESTTLRSALLQTQAQAAARLVADAISLMAQRRLEEAETLLLQAKSLDEHNDRADGLLTQLGVDRRLVQAEKKAADFLAKRNLVGARQVIAEGLKSNPRYEPLLALQRRLDAEAREERLQATQLGLAEKRPISLDFREANLRTVLDVVSRNSGINFVLDKDIRSDVRVTVYLKSTKVEDAIDLIVSTNQLSKKVLDAQTILIYPNTPEKQKEHQEQVVRVFYLANAEAKNAAAFLRSMLKLRDPYVDERSNMLALRETPDNIQLAEKLITLFDANDPEVLLELEVIEVGSSRLTELGVQIPNTFSLTLLPPLGESRLTLGNLPNLTRNDVGVSVSNLLVNFKKTIGDVNTLASPRIRVRSREKAKVLIGDKIPIITATQGTGGFVSDSVSYIDVGLKLEVEPTIYTDDDVVIKVGLEVSSLGTQVRTASGSLAYQIGTRNANTLLRLHDGQTQLLAGLISRDERTSASRIPLVGDVPVLGRLFSNQSDTNQRTELVLAITPRVLRNVRVPDASEAELWVGTETSQRLRPPFGRADIAAPAQKQEGAPSSGTAPPGVGGASSQTPEMPAAVPVNPPLAPTSAVVVNWVGPPEAKVGQTVDLAVRVKTSVPLRGIPLQITYPKDKLKLLEAGEGGFLKQGGAGTSLAKTIDEAAGRIQLGALRQQASGASGDGDVVVLKFKALAAGWAEVALIGFEPIGLEGSPMPPKLPIVHGMPVK